MAYDHELARRIRDRLQALKVPEVEEKAMMGGLVFMVDGKMCLCALADTMLCRLDPDDVTAALARPGCSPMAFTGRVMKGFLVVAPEGMSTRAEFESWIAQALDFNPRATSAKKGARKIPARVSEPGAPRRRPGALSALLLASLGLCKGAVGSDMTRGAEFEPVFGVKFSDAVSRSSEIVAARKTGVSGSVVERQPERYKCTFLYDAWIVDSALAGKAPWKRGDTVRVFGTDQDQECRRQHQYATMGLSVNLHSVWYQSPTRLQEPVAPGARGILLGHPHGKRGLELQCHGCIEGSDQAPRIRAFLRDSTPPQPRF